MDGSWTAVWNGTFCSNCCKLRSIIRRRKPRRCRRRGARRRTRVAALLRFPRWELKNNSMRNAAQWILLLSPLALAGADVNPDAYLAHIQYLASPELKGRATGSPELENAAAYIAGQLQSVGLKPVTC